MKKNRIALIGIIIGVIILILILSTSLLSYDINTGENIFDNKNNKYNNEINENSKYEKKVIGETSYGSVKKLGPYGDPNSSVKIAYIIGVHPLESNVHNIFLESLINKSNLKYEYYIYKINVSQNTEDYEKGRMNGQLLAKEYVVDDVVKNNFDLAIDIHSNEGNWEENQFIFAPSEQGKAKDIATEITNKISWLSYYDPPNPTSPFYLTIPLIEKEIPSVIYEEYLNTPNNEIKNNINELINVIDNLSYN